MESKTTQRASSTAEESATERQTVTDTTLPAPLEELQFYETPDGALYAENPETGALSAIEGGEDGTAIKPALVDVDSDEVTELDAATAMSVRDGSTTSERERTGRGD